MRFQIQHHPEVTSTNTLAKEAAEQGAGEGLVIWADHQTKGRGKLTNQWLSSRGKNLLFSLLTRPPIDSAHAPMLTQIACRSVANVLGTEYAIESHFKYPNDILVHGKKICGILVESSAKPSQVLEYAVIGIGLNVHDAPKELKDKAVAMKEITGKEFDLTLLLNQVLAQLDKDLAGLYAHSS